MYAYCSVASPSNKTPIIGNPDQAEKTTRPIRNGVRLPTSDVPLLYTRDQFEQLDDDISRGERSYLEYMLLGCYPEGPFFDGVETCKKHEYIDSLISKLIDNRQFTALNELLQECDPLYCLNIYPYKFSSNLFSQFLQTVSETQPSLRQLIFVVPMAIGLHSDFSEKVEVIVDFILQSPHLEKFDIVGVDDRFSPKILEAIAAVGSAKAITFHFRRNVTDTIGEHLSQLIRRCANLQSVSLRDLHFSDKKSAEIFQSLRLCPQLHSLSFSKWNFTSIEACKELQQFIQESTTLESFTCEDWFSKMSNDPAISNSERLSTFAQGLAANRSLKSLSLGSFFPCSQHNHATSLVSALERHPNIERLDFLGDGYYAFDDLDGLKLLSDLVEKNQRIIEMKGLRSSPFSFSDNLDHYAADQEDQCSMVTKIVEDRLARNRAIASGNLARTFSKAFFASPGEPVGSNHIGDPGLYLTEQLLRLSPNLPSFENTMVEVALSVDETAKHEQAASLEIKHPDLPASSST
jgi:hypothetical protein